MEMARMESALKTLGRCVRHVPEETVRDMTKTVRKLEAIRAQKAEVTATQKAPEKLREATRDLQQKKQGPRKLK